MTGRSPQGDLWLDVRREWMDGQHRALKAGGYPPDYFADEVSDDGEAESAVAALRLTGKIAPVLDLDGKDSCAVVGVIVGART